MGGPITWRSVMGASLADASRPLALAQPSFNGSFDTLNNALKERQAAEEVARTRQKDNATQLFMGDIQAIDSPEAFQAARDGLYQRLAQAGAGVDQAALRGALDGRLGTLQQRYVQGQAYKDNLQAAGDKEEALRFRPQMTSIQGRIAQGREEDVGPDIEALPERLRAELFKAADERRQLEVGRERDATKFERDGKQHDLNLRQGEARIKESNAHVAEAGLRQQLTRRQIDSANEERLLSDALGQAYLAARGNMTANGMPVENVMTNAAEQVGGNLAPRLQAKLLQAARSADQANVEAWRTEQDRNGYVGATALNPGAVMGDLDEVITKSVPKEHQERVRGTVGRILRDGYVVKKGTKLDDNFIVEQDTTIPIPFGVMRPIIQGSEDPTRWYNPFSWISGQEDDIENAVAAQMKRPEVIRDVRARMLAEQLRAAARKDPQSQLPANSPSKKK